MYFKGENFAIYHGDNRQILPTLAENSVDAIVTDPPYELGFMGKSWDASGVAFDPATWREALRVLKPGGHLIAFSGSRTYHRMAVAIEDAGFEIRDQIMWIYGSGFPKSLNIAKAIDKANGFEGEVIGKGTSWNRPNSEEGDVARMNTSPGEYDIRELSHQAKQWEGWGTALKPAHEPMVLARKPLIGTVAANVLTYGTGGLNIDGSRVGSEIISTHNAPKGTFAGGEPNRGSDTSTYQNHQGRWPANVIHDGLEEEWARFFYCAKASKRDRNKGLDGFEVKQTLGGGGLTEVGGAYGSIKAAGQNHHPTVKPTDLMRYLCRLITPPNGTVLDPFMGSGSTGKAAIYEGFKFIGIEMTDEYLSIAKARIEFAVSDDEGFLL